MLVSSKGCDCWHYRICASIWLRENTVESCPSNAFTFMTSGTRSQLSGSSWWVKSVRKSLTLFFKSCNTLTQALETPALFPTAYPWGRWILGERFFQKLVTWIDNKTIRVPLLEKVVWEESLCLSALISTHHSFTFLVRGGREPHLSFVN